MSQPKNYIRQGITLAGTKVVIVAANLVDVDDCRHLLEAAVEQHGDHILHVPAALFEGDPVLTQPILDLDLQKILGYVELAP